MTGAPGGPALARASLVLVGLAWTVPFLQPHHQYPLTAFYNEWLALALGIGAALLLLRGASWRQAAVPAVALPCAGLILLIGVQAALGRVPYAEQALVAALFLLWAMLLVLLGRVLQQEMGLAAVADGLAWFLLAGGLLNTLAGLLQLYGVSGPLGFLIAGTESPAVYGNLRQPNHFAAYIAMACASAGFLYGRGRLHGAGAGACLALFAVILAVAGSRSSWLYLGAFTALAAVWHRARRDAASRRLAVFGWWLLPAFVLAQWVTSLPLLQPERGVLTAAQRLFEMASGIDARLQLAREAWRMFLAAPLLGAGWGQFAWQHFLYLGESGAGAAPGICNHAHNIVLQLLAETGLAGGFLLACAAWLWLSDLRQARFDLEWWWLVALAAVLGVHSMLEYPLWYAYFLGVAALLAGLSSRRLVPLRMPGAARLVVALGMVVGAIDLIAVLAPYRDLERLVFDPAQRAAPDPSDAAMSSAFARAHGEPALAPYVELVLAHGIEVTRERLPEKLELNTRVMHFAPVNVVVFRQAMLLALAGEGAAAARQLERAARAYPEELDDAVPQLAELARRHPAELTPLLELAAARQAELRRRRAPAGGARRR